MKLRIMNACRASLQVKVESFMKNEGQNFCVRSNKALPLLAKQPDIKSRLSELKKNLRQNLEIEGTLSSNMSSRSSFKFPSQNKKRLTVPRHSIRKLDPLAQPIVVSPDKAITVKQTRIKSVLLAPVSAEIKAAPFNLYGIEPPSKDKPCNDSPSLAVSNFTRPRIASMQIRLDETSLD